MKEPVWIEERDALALHERLLALHGGIAGIRDATLLSSGLARPRQQFAAGTLDEESFTAFLRANTQPA
ncbi:MAG: hypothetical protein EPN21_10595 [Methylococcaceae bacterium]|nr:MAG: hypothetical protein EPN21_10595 [Methylococcaceae bacterium]